MNWVKVSENPSYSVNEFGEVRNDSTGKMKKPTLNKKNNYYYVDLWQNNSSVKYTVHSLVAKAFIPNPKGKPCVDHKDGNRQNNNVSNLRWATFSENNSRFETIGVRSEKVKVTHYKEVKKKTGGHEPWSEKDSEMIFDRIKDVATYFEVTQANITPLLKSGNIGRRGKMRGYKFEYVK